MFNRKRSTESSVTYGQFLVEPLATDEPKLNKMQKFRLFVKALRPATVIVGFVVGGVILVSFTLATGGLTTVAGVVCIVVGSALYVRLARNDAKLTPTREEPLSL